MVQKVDLCFPKPEMTSSNVHKPKDVQLSVVEEKRNQRIFTSESWNQRVLTRIYLFFIIEKLFKLIKYHNCW